MAKAPVSQPESKGIARLIGRLPLGTKLISAGVLLFIVTRIIKWLPLGILGSWVNGFIYPVLLLCIVAGGFLTYRKAKA